MAAHGRALLVARWRIAVAFLLALGLAAGGWSGHRMMPFAEITLLRMESASACRVFSNNAARAIEVSFSDRAEMTAWMTQSLGRARGSARPLPGGLQAAGRAGPGALSGGAVMLICEKPDDDRLTFYVRPMRIGHEAEMQPLKVRALDTYNWINRQTGFSVMSDGDRELLRPVAHLIRNGLRP